MLIPSNAVTHFTPVLMFIFDSYNGFCKNFVSFDATMKVINYVYHQNYDIRLFIDNIVVKANVLFCFIILICICQQ